MLTVSSPTSFRSDVDDHKDNKAGRVYNKNMEDRTMEGKRLYRSRKDRMICGVCGGIAKYFNIDPTLVRLAFVLISMGAGSGVLAYIVVAIIIPDDPEEN